MGFCEMLERCPFYNDRMDIESGIGKMYKRKYCEESKESCARYKVATTVGREKVPADLYPNMIEKALDIIKLG